MPKEYKQYKVDRYGIVKNKVCKDPNLSVQAKGLYAILSCYANKNRICWPSISTLADDCGSSQSSIKRWIKELKSYNYIRRKGNKLIIL